MLIGISWRLAHQKNPICSVQTPIIKKGEERRLGGGGGGGGTKKAADLG